MFSNRKFIYFGKPDDDNVTEIFQLMFQGEDQ